MVRGGRDQSIECSPAFVSDMRQELGVEPLPPSANRADNWGHGLAGTLTGDHQVQSRPCHEMVEVVHNTLSAAIVVTTGY